MTTGLLIFIVTLVVYSLSLNIVWAVDHSTSFLQLDYAMWARHSFVLGNGSNFTPGTRSVPGSVDDFLYNGNYYSALAPGTAILALPFSGIGFVLDGGFTLFGYSSLFAEFSVALANAIAASLVYLVGRFFFDKKISTFLAFAYAFATISWPFATYLFQSDVSAMFCLLAIYFVIRGTRLHEGRATSAVLAGSAVAVAMLVDYINAIFLPILLLYLILSSMKDRQPFARSALGFGATALLGVVLIGLYNYVNFGSPLLGGEQLYLHASSVFYEFSTPLYSGAFLNLFSPYRGLFVYCVFLVLGLFGYYRMIRRSRYRREALLFVVCFLGIFVPYSMWYIPSGGESFGPRFLAAAIPFLLLPAGMVIQGKDRKLQALAYVLYVVGVFWNGVAGLTSAVTPVFNEWVSPFFAWTLPLFLRGGVDVWWSRYLGGESRLIPSYAIIAFAMAIPLVSVYIIGRREAASQSKRGTTETRQVQ